MESLIATLLAHIIVFKDKRLLKILLGIVSVLIFIGFIGVNMNETETDDWHNYDGSEIVCRVTYCGNTPLYSNWEDRYCEEHIYKSANYSDEFDSSVITKRVNTTPALTKEQAEKLKGTGYGNTRPNSSAELSKIKAAMVTCKKCGMHSDNGRNSLCDECQYNEEFGLD